MLVIGATDVYLKEKVMTQFVTNAVEDDANR